MSETPGDEVNRNWPGIISVCCALGALFASVLNLGVSSDALYPAVRTCSLLICGVGAVFGFLGFTSPRSAKMNVIGLCLNAVFLLCILCTPYSIQSAKPRDKVNRVKGEMRALARALEAYHDDHGAYPAWAVGAQGVNADAPPDSPPFQAPTFRVWSSNREAGSFATLTTPTAYLAGYPGDCLLRPSLRENTFSYFADDNGWILISPGFDGIRDIDPLIHYDSSIDQPSEALILRSYDPTNGTFSSGDVWRVAE